MIKPNYLRLSVTNSCNLNCIYCSPLQKKINGRGELSPEETGQLIRWFGNWGVKKVRITGGEPLMRKDITGLIKIISSLAQITEVSMTTNGTLLSGYLETLKSVGLSNINISLDTLKRKKYQQITGKDKFPDVIEAIEAASNMHFRSLGMNMVVLKGINDDEIFDFLKLTKGQAINVRFIEFMDSTSYIDFKKLHLSINNIKKRIENRYGKLVPAASSELSGPARYYKIKDFRGNIGFISYRTNGSCSSCNRLRLTPDGHLLPCLFSSIKIDIKTPLRNHNAEADIKRLFDHACKLKREINGLDRNFYKTSFSQIGG